MNVALAGLTAREAVALDMLVGKSLPGWQCSAAPAGRHVPLPPADLYVVDLAGRGLARWTEAAQDDLFQSLHGVPAVLVAPAFDQTWSALDAHRMKSQSLVLLHKPYGVEDMRAALSQAAAGRASRAAPVALPALPPLPVSARAPAASVVRGTAAPVAVSSASLPAPAAAPVEIGEVTVSEFQAWLVGLPASESQLFLRKLAEALARQQPFEVRVTFLNRLIFHPGERWVASSTPVAVLQGLCQSDALASAAAIDAIDDKDALARAERLDMPIQPLEAFLWALMPAASQKVLILKPPETTFP
jgi:hypothetical protein